MSDYSATKTYKLCAKLIDMFFPHYEYVGLENLPEESAVIVGNHSQMNGPIIGELRMPRTCYTWCAAQMMHEEDVAEYAFTDFWSFKPEWTHPFYRLVSRLIVPLSVRIFNSARVVPVYRDTRILTTFRSSIARLNKGSDLLIFPEQNKRLNNIVYDFQDKFVDTARFYYKKTGRELQFVPLYICPKLRKLVFGKPIRFDASAPIDKERERICSYLIEEISSLARALPEHTVIPYRNIPKRDYPKNIPAISYKT